jgi:hypothetical protein
VCLVRLSVVSQLTVSLSCLQAVMVLQCAARCWRSRKVLGALRAERLQSAKSFLAHSLVQAMETRRVALRWKSVAARVVALRRVQAALTLQCAVRCWCSRKVLAALRAERLQRSKEFLAHQLLQSMETRRVALRWKSVTRRLVQAERSAITIQRFVRRTHSQRRNKVRTVL